MVYNRLSSNIIKKFKFSDNTALKAFLVKLLVNKANASLNHLQIHYICPVPLHYTRLIARRYNQSATLAKPLAKKLQIPYLYNLVIKCKITKKQALLAKNSRATNVLNAFKFNKRYKQAIKGKNILLVDDVVTTASTVNEIAKVLKLNGAKNVYVLSVCKSLNG